MAEPKTYTQEEFDAKAAEVQKLKDKADELLAEKKAAKKALDEYEGLDPKTAKALKKAADDAEAAAAQARGDFTAREKQMAEAHGRDLEKVKGRSAKLEKAVHKRTAEAEIRRAIAKAEGDAELLLPHAMPFVKVRETDDDFEAYLEEKGQPMVSDGKGTPMSFDTFVTERLIPRFPGAFKGTGSSGGGATRSAGSASGAGRIVPAGAAWSKADIDDIATGKAVVK